MEQPEPLIDIGSIDVESYLIKAQQWLHENLLNIDSAAQIAWFTGALVLSYIIAGIGLRVVRPKVEGINNFFLKRFAGAFLPIIAPIIALFLLQLYPIAAELLNLRINLAILFENLLGAWIIIRFFSAFIANRSLARTVASFVWMIAALNTFGLLTPITEQLDALGFTMGENRISLLLIIKGVLTIGVLLWAAGALSSLSERKLQNVRNLTPSLRVLISKSIRVSLIVFAGLIGLNTLGIDLTSLAVFSGAVGVGLGFGLQKVVSNFISGIILLLDRSIKPGDVIALDETYGWVNKLSARHVSVITRDGKEHLIPNELLITERVENWSYSDKNIRLKIPAGISYNNDPRKAIELMKEAVAECPRVLKYPKPVALCTGFGDSSVDLELRCWIDDPANGLRNIQSEIYLNIWDKFKENGIEIPFPQRDVHIKSKAD